MPTPDVPVPPPMNVPDAVAAPMYEADPATSVSPLEGASSALTNAAEAGRVLRVPINHFEGNYTCSPETLAELRADDRVVLRYVDNPNGSIDDIAGVCNEGRNVVGLMPHPERAISDLLGSTDGIPLVQSLIAAGTRQPA